jgi:hypothetical protein
MTPMQAILSDLAAAQLALRQSSTAFDEAVDGIGHSMDAMRATLDAIRAANHAQGVAIDAVIAATNKGLALVTGKPS